MHKLKKQYTRNKFIHTKNSIILKQYNLLQHNLITRKEFVCNSIIVSCITVNSFIEIKRVLNDL